MWIFYPCGAITGKFACIATSVNPDRVTHLSQIEKEKNSKTLSFYLNWIFF